MRKTHQDRIALIDRLEKKYSQKVQLYKQRKHERSIKQQLRTIRGSRLMQSSEDSLRYEAPDIFMHDGQRLAY